MAKDLTTTKYEPIQPEGLALALLVVTIAFTILSSIVTGLRFYVLNLAHNASVIVLSFSGIGSHDDIITVVHIRLGRAPYQIEHHLDAAPDCQELDEQDISKHPVGTVRAGLDRLADIMARGDFPVQTHISSMEPPGRLHLGADGHPERVVLRFGGQHLYRYMHRTGALFFAPPPPDALED
ncbi:hypothetical protein NECHADRAFT_76517 [Paecilomyces variotii No. 5]|uniref:Uncharacterized protein n=1 Tax=Byssochlamys spectabilis (strain No. 5 / NBRC 109023) TaxID=1356009 RepID=V5FUN0_BYSSN|nr:hypothetical protein NECHADRAFT_76517 [Paecilomyces variotii No. 5]